MNNDELHSLGSPNVKVGPVQMWVHGREFEDSKEYYDGNWLRVTVHCGGAGASVRVGGAILMTVDLEGFAKGCDELWRREGDEAVLEPMEPNLRLCLTRADDAGHISGEVDITPDQLLQDHSFRFDLDQSYLPGIIQQCRAIIRDFPVVGRKADGSR